MLDRELFVYFQYEDEFAKLEFINLSSMRVSNRIIPPSESVFYVMYTSLSLYIYIYIYRERDVYVCVYIYIYMYRERFIIIWLYV